MTDERTEHRSHWAMAAVTEYPVQFSSAGTETLLLEGNLALAERSAEDREKQRPLVVVCHPQPLTTTMDDPLTARITSDLARAGFLALRFNFRGVGQSQGEPSDGRFEPLDLAGAVAFLRSQPLADPQRLCIVGHAFGAYIALVYAAADVRVGTVVAISMPVYHITSALARFEQPRLFVTGEHDEVSPQHKLVPWLEQLPGTRNLRVISGASHLMRGSEAAVSTTVVQYLVHWAKLPDV